MNSRTKRLSEIEDFEDFSGYAVDVEGHLWSLKYKTPKLRKPVWAGTGECRYLTFRVRDDYGKAKTLYLHKLVALAFLPCDDPSRRVVHKNKDRSDNRLENLEWVANIKEKQEALDFILQRSLVENPTGTYRSTEERIKGWRFLQFYYRDGRECSRCLYHAIWTTESDGNPMSIMVKKNPRPQPS